MKCNNGEKKNMIKYSLEYSLVECITFYSCIVKKQKPKKTPNRAIIRKIERCHQPCSSAWWNILAVGDDWEEKQWDPLPGLLIHYQFRASQQASTTTYQGAQLLYCQGPVGFNMGPTLCFPRFSTWLQTLSHFPDTSTHRKKNKQKKNPHTYTKGLK